MPDLTSLNEEQHQAVTHGTGPLLIIAGAGTGKTTGRPERHGENRGAKRKGKEWVAES